MDRPQRPMKYFRATKDANDRKLARRKFRQAMREDIITKAPGMKFVVNMAGKKQRVTPRQVHLSLGERGGQSF